MILIIQKYIDCLMLMENNIYIIRVSRKYVSYYNNNKNMYISFDIVILLLIDLHFQLCVIFIQEINIQIEINIQGTNKSNIQGIASLSVI